MVGGGAKAPPLLYKERENKIYRKIRDMMVGEIGYCVPWAIDIVGFTCTYCLDMLYTIDPSGGGANTVKIARTKNGYVAIVPEKEYKFKELSGNTYTDNAERFVPLYKITFTDGERKNEMSQAKIQTHMVTHKLNDIPVDNTVHIASKDIFIDENNNVWVNVNAEFLFYAAFGYLKITKKKDGFYVEGRFTNAPYTWSKISLSGYNVALQPVKSILFV